MILRNQGRCEKCDDFIPSIHRHDFRTCKCGNSAVDGGPAYLRRMGEIEDKSICISEDLPYREAAKYLGVVIALAEANAVIFTGERLSTSLVRDAMKKQAKKKPWFGVPKDNRETLKWLRHSASWGLVSGIKVGSTYYWISNFEVAPWIEAR